ncbi:MAG: sugar nucleotidyltransferase [archaeon]
MKGIILAGGNGTRLRPLTSVTNKHLLPVYDKPMIFYPLQTLKDAGIREILIITGTEHAGNIFKLMGSGKEFGTKFTYKVQDEAGGLPHAIALAEDFVGEDRFISINGDNILSESIRPFVEGFGQGNEQSRILLYQTTIEEARKAGVAQMEGDQIVGFVEKPSDPPTTLISIGVYMYTKDVFDVIRTLHPSRRGELEITDIHNIYLKRRALTTRTIGGEWLDAGTVDELSRANRIVRGWKGVHSGNGK